MAGDWIKMRGNLWDDPRVAAICDACDCGEAQVIGALYWLWATADQHTEDGLMPGLTLRQIDRKTGVAGFGAAMESIGWIRVTEDGVILARFDEHNGASAKRRCMEAQRKANARNVSASDADNAQTEAGQIPPNCGAREREEKSNTSSLRSEVARKRATRQAPRDMTVSTEVRDWVAERRLAVNVDAEFEKFRDHTFKNPISDWDGALRNWLRKAAEGGQYGPQARASPGRAPTAAEARALQAVPSIAAPHLRPAQPVQFVEEVHYESPLALG